MRIKGTIKWDDRTESFDCDLDDQMELIPRTKDDRIAELEGALRTLLAYDEARFGWEGEPSAVEKQCRVVLRQ